MRALQIRPQPLLVESFRALVEASGVHDRNLNFESSDVDSNTSTAIHPIERDGSSFRWVTPGSKANAKDQLPGRLWELGAWKRRDAGPVNFMFVRLLLPDLKTNCVAASPLISPPETAIAIRVEPTCGR
jgi:hypothetical protein